tara:strand:+ start:252 stop:488 length:237 start_codon:yes stop_codon:yes gene_type:complete
MFSIEHEYDASVVISMDEKEQYEDIEMHLSNDGTVFFRQYDSDLDDHHLIAISYQQLLDLWASMKQTEGLFRLKLLGD